jgi:5-methylcytosine-specific restriction endonuclease McrA
MKSPKQSVYPEDWQKISKRIKDQTGWKCECCGHPDDKPSGHVLMAHHLDGNPQNCEDWNLAALCESCHLNIQGRIKMDQLFFLNVMPISNWFKPHYDGYLASVGFCLTKA